MDFHSYELLKKHNLRRPSFTKYLDCLWEFPSKRYCYSHGKSLPSNASLMVGKRVLQGEAWSDLSDSYGTHDLGDKLGDYFGDLATNLATLATNR
ncbi:hypothetical protein AVEN_220296-1 [Araneus ventricosus]|uniref:Uncharacterized protein n=1 Tax=Araneus ventricosus TaxID=182803 RepID=A0A4Y2WCA2_ARAVE|nr:hypothetical protein AVEN_78411-1 [Araneus ventricosus]GBO33687.1 hypothetical protein AVEN_220296-1 [Araneus ventricosus]